MFKKLFLVTPFPLASAPLNAGMCGTGCDWASCAPWDKVACMLAGIAFVIVAVAAYSGLLVLLKSVTPKFVERCAKSISGHTLRNFIVGLLILVAWLIVANLYEGNEKALGVMVMLLGLLWTVKMFGGAAMIGMIGAKALALRGGKKQADGVKNIVAGLTVVVLTMLTIIPGLLVFLVLSCIELGATVCVALKMK